MKIIQHVKSFSMYNCYADTKILRKEVLHYKRPGFSSLLIYFLLSSSSFAGQEGFNNATAEAIGWTFVVIYSSFSGSRQQYIMETHKN